MFPSKQTESVGVTVLLPGTRLWSFTSSVRLWLLPRGVKAGKCGPAARLFAANHPSERSGSQKRLKIERGAFGSCRGETGGDGGEEQKGRGRKTEGKVSIPPLGRRIVWRADIYRLTGILFSCGCT